MKNTGLENSDLTSIDVNSWFRSNSLSPSSMNEIRQYIFEEWLHKKIKSAKPKVLSGTILIIVYDNPTDLFIDLLKQKISNIFDSEICDMVLLD